MNPASMFRLAPPLVLLALSLAACGDSKKQKGGGLAVGSQTAAVKSSHAGSDIISLGDSGPACEEWPVRPQFADLPAPPDVANPPKDAHRAPSGVLFKIVADSEATPTEVKDAGPAARQDGGGSAVATRLHPGPTDLVQVQYSGWTQAGTPIIQIPGATTVPMSAPEQILSANLLPKALLGTVSLLYPGQRARVWIPVNLAFSDKTQKDVPCGPLVYEVELKSVFRAPADLNSPPTEKTSGGIGIRTMSKGAGPLPKANDSVTFHIAIWGRGTGDKAGQMLKPNTYIGGAPDTEQLSALPKGLAEVISQMHVGDKAHAFTTYDVLLGQPMPETIEILAEIELLAAHK